MEAEQFKNMLTSKPDTEILVKQILEQPSLIADLISIIKSEKGSIKFLCTKLIRLASEQTPVIVYEYFSEIAKFLYSENSFIKWDGITILSNLVSVDTEGKFQNIYEEYFSLLNDPQMITAANVAGNAWKIILSKPQYEADITRRLLQVSKNTYYNKGKPSPECKNILYGHIIDCMEKYYKTSQCKNEITGFVTEQTTNSRKAVGKKAERFLKKYQYK